MKRQATTELIDLVKRSQTGNVSSETMVALVLQFRSE